MEERYGGSSAAAASSGSVAAGNHLATAPLSPRGSADLGDPAPLDARATTAATGQEALAPAPSNAHAADADDKYSWVGCDRCSEWRLVPKGTMEAFKGDRFFQCSYAGYARCIPLVAPKKTPGASVRASKKRPAAAE